MKKFIVAAVVVMAFVATNAIARDCGNTYHQWPEKRVCKAEPKPEPVKAAPVPEKIILEGVTFDTGSARIKPQSYGVLDKNADVLAKHKDLKAIVVGYTDDRGSAKLNEKLSAARANSVKEYLEKKGVDSLRLRSEGRGPADPVADNKNADGRAQNRRIELHTTK